MPIAGKFLVVSVVAAVATQESPPQAVRPLPACAHPAGIIPGMDLSPKERARSRLAHQEASKYLGTTVAAGKALGPRPERWEEVSRLLSEAEVIPSERLRRFARLDPDFRVVGWRLTVEKLEVRAGEILVRARVAPILMSLAGGTVGVMTDYHENYLIADAAPTFLGADPGPENPIVMMGVM